MRVRNTVNHEFESQLERVESVARHGTAAAKTAPTALHGKGGGTPPPAIVCSSKTTYLKMAAYSKSSSSSSKCFGTEQVSMWIPCHELYGQHLE